MYLKLLSIFLIISLFLDQFFKTLILYYLNLKQLVYLEVIPGFLNFILAWNKGINFGLFNNENYNAKYFLIIISICICLAIFFWVRKKNKKLLFIFSGLVIGGALGNCIDRIIYGAVVDYLNITCCGVKNPFSFNLADTFIFLGIFGLIVFSESEKKSKIDY